MIHIPARRTIGYCFLRHICFTLALVTVCCPTPAIGQPVADRDTLLLVPFDRGYDAGHALGTSRGQSNAPLVPGRFGRGVDLREGYSVTFTGNDGNFRAASGTLEFWIKPHWDGTDTNRHSIFNCQFGSRGYINVNTLGKGQVGVAMSAGEGDSWKWRRSDADISAWVRDEWHHVACAWGEGHLTIYVDGQRGRRTADDAQMPQHVPETLTFSACDAVLDSIRISKRRFTDDDVRRAIERARGPAPYRFLDEMVESSSSNCMVNYRLRLGGVRIPLILGSTHLARAIGLKPNAEVSFVLDGGYAEFSATVGLDRFSAPDAACTFQVWGDDRQLAQWGPFTARQKPEPVAVSISGVKRLTLKCVADQADRAAGPGVWANAAVARTGQQPVTCPARPMDKERLSMYERQQGADQYFFPIDGQRPFLVAAKYWEDDLDPTAAPRADRIGKPLSGFCTPGEYEPLNFVVYAVRDLSDVRVSVTELRGAQGRLSASEIDVRLVQRGLMRDIYSRPVEQSTVVSRFLLENQPIDVPAGTLREWHSIVHIPNGTPAGVYRGAVSIVSEGERPFTLPVEFEVLPIRLQTLQNKAYGVYYRFPREGDKWDNVDVELADIRLHGGTLLKAAMGVEYLREDGDVRSSVERLKRCLKLLRKHGFHGPLPVDSGLDRLARLLAYDPAKARESGGGASVQFKAAAGRGLKKLTDTGKEFPEFELLATHMDEVFGRDRLDRYIALTQLVREFTPLRVYITLHNSPRSGVAEMMQQCDPYVDVRSYNGHAMDDWIRAGHSFDELRDELRRSGDEAWTYYNIRGSFFRAEWTRLVNGFYLWTSPLRVHVPWMYYAYFGNPLDDTDGPRVRGHDFAYAVPDPDRPDRMIPTRHWEAFREGIDDMRYLNTLEALIAQHASAPDAVAARKWLEQLRKSLDFTHAELDSIDKESPILILWSRRFDGADYRRMRREAADYIQRLQSR